MLKAGDYYWNSSGFFAYVQYNPDNSGGFNILWLPPVLKGDLCSQMLSDLCISTIWEATVSTDSWQASSFLEVLRTPHYRNLSGRCFPHWSKMEELVRLLKGAEQTEANTSSLYIFLRLNTTILLVFPFPGNVSFIISAVKMCCSSPALRWCLGVC